MKKERCSILKRVSQMVSISGIKVPNLDKVILVIFHSKSAVMWRCGTN